MSRKANKPAEPDLGTKLKQIADRLADRLMVPAVAEELAFEQQILAFKELKSFYAMLKKLPDGEGGSFGGFAKQITDIGHRGRVNGATIPPIGVEPGTVPDTDEPGF